MAATKTIRDRVIELKAAGQKVGDIIASLAAEGITTTKNTVVYYYYGKDRKASAHE